MNPCRIVSLIVLVALVNPGCGTKSVTEEQIASQTPQFNPKRESPPSSVSETLPQVQPDDEPDEDTLIATRALSENCTICHASDLIQSQRLTAKQWKAEVEKMIGWGSPLPADQQEGLTQYLTKTYPEALPREPAATLTSAAALSTILPDSDAEKLDAGDSGRGEMVFAMTCKNCHGEHGEGSPLGPNLVERPVLTRPQDFVAVINKGRGRMPMLGPLVNKKASQDILTWLRSKRYSQPFPSKS